MSALTLYDLAGDIAAVRDLLEAGAAEGDDLALADEALTRALGELLPAKVSGYCGFMAELAAFEGAAKAEEERIACRRRVAGNLRERMKERLKEGLQRAGVQTLDAGTFRVSIQRNPPSVVITDPQAIPTDLVRTRVEIDKSAVLRALKAGDDVPGAALAEESYHVRIR